MTQARLGELIVGAYLRIIRGCEIVSYNQRSEEAGDQMEMDVLGIRSEDGQQTVYGCEVITHLNGMRYSGTPDTDEWEEFGNETHQNTIERIWKKFNEDYRLITKTFDDADEYELEVWSPVVPEGNRTEGLEELRRRFEKEHENPQIRPKIIINGEYSDRVEKLQERASETEKRYEEPAFRFLQILEHRRSDHPITL